MVAIVFPVQTTMPDCVITATDFVREEDQSYTMDTEDLYPMLDLRAEFEALASEGFVPIRRLSSKSAYNVSRHMKRKQTWKQSRAGGP